MTIAPRELAWIAPRPPKPAPAMRLFCFPFAGAGGAIYHQWSRRMPAEVDVCAVEPPGKFARLREPLILNMEAYVSAVDAALSPLLNVPFSIFGYSLGATQAFEWARRLSARSLSPCALIVAARPAPQVLYTQHRISHLPDREFVRHLEQRYGVLDPAIASDPEMLALATTMMRADIEMLEGYRFQPGQPLACPITAFGGDADRSTSPEHIAGWAEQTSAGFDTQQFNGGHFFMKERPAEVIDAVARILKRARPAAAPVVAPAAG